MPLHIGSVSADVTVVDGSAPLNDRQLAQVCNAVLQVLAAKERDDRRQHEATCIARSAQPSSPVRG
ncbi:MAG: hypothetical protein ABIQ15_05335 [Nocardioides sp.]